MDKAAKYNRERWKLLAEAGALFSRPRLDLDMHSAHDLIGRAECFEQLEGKKVLCLASGGGQQSVAFALLGADVTVFDLSDEQLERDRLAAEHYGVEIKIVQGEMRDLGAFDTDAFDIVYQPYSINFVPDCAPVLAEVSRVLKKGGYYHLAFANPFTMATRQENWNGNGYVLNGPYTGGAEITYADQEWVYDRTEESEIQRPIEYRHNLCTIVNGLIASGFTIRHLSDNKDMHPDVSAEPGSWDHFISFAPPWLSILTRLDS